MNVNEPAQIITPFTGIRVLWMDSDGMEWDGMGVLKWMRKLSEGLDSAFGLKEFN